MLAPTTGRSQAREQSAAGASGGDGEVGPGEHPCDRHVVLVIK